MQSMELELGKVVADFDKLLTDIPDMRRGLHEELGNVLQSSLYSEISAKLNDSHGTIRSFQEHVVGSRGGYAAVRAIKGSTGDNSPGAITNYLENGHRIRPRGSGKNYRPRIKVAGAYVSGRHFYMGTSKTIEPKLIAAAEAFCEQLAQRLEGNS